MTLDEGSKKTDEMDSEHELVLQISRQLALDRYVPVAAIDQLRAIHSRLESSCGLSFEPSGVNLVQMGTYSADRRFLSHVTKKIERIRNQLAPRTDDIRIRSSQVQQKILSFVPCDPKRNSPTCKQSLLSMKTFLVDIDTI